MAITTPMTTQQFGKAIDPAVRKHFVDSYEQVKPMFEKVFKVGEQQDYNEQHQNYTGMGQLAVVPQGTTYGKSSPLQAYGTTYTPVKYGDTIEITDEMIRYDKASIATATSIASMQGKEASRSIDKRAAAVYLNGFSTSYTSLGDAKPLFSTLHPRADGGTAQSNASATSIPLTEANLEVGMLALEQVLDDRGELINAYADTLMIPPALRKTGLVIVKSEKRSGTADNDANVYSMKEFEGTYIDKVLVWKYLSPTGNLSNGSNTAWFLQCSEYNKVTWLWGVKPEVGKLNDSIGFMSDTLTWKVRYEASTGWDDWRCNWGSKGDSSAYSS